MRRNGERWENRKDYPKHAKKILQEHIADSSKTLFILAMNKVFFFFMNLKAHIFFFPISIFFRSERGRNGKKKRREKEKPGKFPAIALLWALQIPTVGLTNTVL